MELLPYVILVNGPKRTMWPGRGPRRFRVYFYVGHTLIRLLLLIQLIHTLCATPKKHANVLQHMVGHFRGRLDDASRDELLALIDEYRRERVPLIAPLTLIRHHVRRLGVDYLAGQTYLARSSQLLD